MAEILTDDRQRHVSQRTQISEEGKQQILADDRERHVSQRTQISNFIVFLRLFVRLYKKSVCTQSINQI